MYTFFAAAKASKILPVKLKVKEIRYDGQRLPYNIRDYFENNSQEYAEAYDAVVLEVQEIEESPDGSVGYTDKNVLQSDPSKLSSIKVADLLNLVKGDAEKYIPKTESKQFPRQTLDEMARQSGVKDSVLGKGENDTHNTK